MPWYIGNNACILNVHSDVNDFVRDLRKYSYQRNISNNCAMKPDLASNDVVLVNLIIRDWQGV